MPRNDLAVRNHKLADRSRYDRMSNRFRVHQNILAFERQAGMKERADGLAGRLA